MSLLLKFYFYLSCIWVSISLGFTPQSTLRSHQLLNHYHDSLSRHRHSVPVTTLLSTKKRQRKPLAEDTSSGILDLEEPAGIVGAEFFGGNKQKEEFYDPVAEAQAGEEVQMAATSYNKFEDLKAFSSPTAAAVAQGLQQALNSVLYVDFDRTGASTVQYASNLQWESCFDVKKSSPLQALEETLEFYKQVDVAIVSGTQLSDNQMKFTWQVSVVWPIFWEPRVLLAGSSKVTFRENPDANNVEDSASSPLSSSFVITKQVDALDSSTDLLSTISSQLQPRFWDTYHIGMTPSAELMPRTTVKQGIVPKSYKIFEIPPRLVLAPTQLDSVAGREDGNAQIVPNHAFSCVIKTMGPQKQTYVPASPVQVNIMPSGKPGGGPPRIKWSIPVSVDYQTTSNLSLPGEDPEARLDSEPRCDYEFQDRRLVATVPFGGSPQDVKIADVRKKLYDAVVKDGLKPALGENKRPQFFFLLNGVKSCYTQEGLGMCVYEWRPETAKPNEVGIELELK